MIEVLQFIFSSFWVWLGTLFLAAVVFGSLAAAIGSGASKPCRCQEKETP